MPLLKTADGLNSMAALLKGVAGHFLLPKSQNEDLARRELILNLIISFSIFCFSLINLIRLWDVISNPSDRGLPVIYTLAILVFFIILALMSRRGYIKTASWLVIVTYAVPAIYSFYIWGADLPAALLLDVLIITFCGLLISAKAAFFSALVLNAFLLILTYAQANNIITVRSYWRAENHELGDAIVYAVLLLLITALVFIFDREIRRALVRAKSSEAELRQERDDLEIRVAERTSLIREMEADKISQLYRLAEFGRISSGIFHDLVNPLTAVSLNLEQVKKSELIEGADVSIERLGEAKDCLSQAIVAARKMEDLIACIKRSIKQESIHSLFSLPEEIRSIIKILSYKARQAGVTIHFSSQADVCCHGDAVKLGQIMTNLICNSIEACENANEQAPVGKKIERNVHIFLRHFGQNAIIEVHDNGSGILSENCTKIFQPFFSTKQGRGLGLGLSSTKNIIEHDFGGEIKANSRPGQETIFTVTLPLNYEN